MRPVHKNKTCVVNHPCKSSTHADSSEWIVFLTNVLAGFADSARRSTALRYLLAAHCIIWFRISFVIDHCNGPRNDVAKNENKTFSMLSYSVT